MSMDDSVVSGSTPPECATETTRSRSRMVSLNTREDTSVSGIGAQVPAGEKGHVLNGRVFDLGGCAEPGEHRARRGDLLAVEGAAESDLEEGRPMTTRRLIESGCTSALRLLLVLEAGRSCQHHP